MCVSQTIFKNSLLLILSFLFTLQLFSQAHTDVYGEGFNTTKKLVFKVRVEKINSQILKGFLKEIKENSIVITRSKFVSVDKQDVKLFEIPLEQIRKIRISKANQFVKDYFITLVSLSVGSLIFDTANHDSFFGFGFITLVFSTMAIPVSFLIAGVSKISQTLNITYNGNQESYTRSKNLIMAFLLKRNKKFKNQVQNITIKN